MPGLRNGLALPKDHSIVHLMLHGACCMAGGVPTVHFMENLTANTQTYTHTQNLPVSKGQALS